MKKEDIEHLAKLARIAVTDSEADVLAGDITNIIGLVSQIEEITGDTELEKKIGALYNVMRVDENPHAGGLYTEDLLTAAPSRDGQYVKVKKILDKKI